MNYQIEQAKAEDYEQIILLMSVFNMHYIPSPEMNELDINNFFVARVSDKIVGAAGYRLLDKSKGKTTLLAVLPEFGNMGIGKALQHKRMEVMYKLGINSVETNADRPETILWYKKHFGYQEIGRLKKLCEFGLATEDKWTTLATDLSCYFSSYQQRQQQRDQYIDENDAFPLANYPPLIINACLTGMVPSREQTPHVPLSCDEIIEDAIQVVNAGATMLHIHARDEEGKPTPDVSYYERILSGIRAECPNVVITVTTSGRNWSDFERRSQVLYMTGLAKPDMGSLTLGSLNFLSGASVNTIEMVERLAMTMKEQDIKPELEVFDLGMVNIIKYLERNNIISGPKYVNILLGNLNTAPANISSLAAITSELPSNTQWGATGLGQFQLPINTAAIVAGGHVRVGLEDSIYYDYEKSVLASNINLVERVVRISNELMRPIATPNQTRQLLGL